jgi:hypothetical protein
LLVRDLTFFGNSTDQILQWDAGQLANEGERILLMNAVGMVVDHVRYEPEAPWPIPAMGTESLQLISADLDNHFASSWMLNELQIGIEEPPASSDVRVYPNPSKSSVWVESRASIELIQAFNGLGQQIHIWFGSSNRTELDVSSWSNGTYVLLINGSKTIRLIRQ